MLKKIIINLRHGRKRKGHLALSVGPIREHSGAAIVSSTNRFCKGKFLMALVLSDTQQCKLAVAFQDAKGNPAKVDGIPQWSVSDANILSITQTADGMSATIVANGPLGTAQVSVQADADMGPGVRTIVGTLDVEIVAGEAVVAVVSGGVPEAQP